MEKRERAQVNKIKNERVKIIIDITEIQRIIRDYLIISQTNWTT